MKRLARQDGAKPSLMGGIERNFASSSPSSFAETLDFRTNWPRVGACSQCRIQTLRWGGEGGGRGEREKVGAGLQKKYFWPFGPQFGLKIRGGHLGHSAGSATGSYLVYVTRYTFGSFSSLITSSLFSCWFISLKKKIKKIFTPALNDL